MKDRSFLYELRAYLIYVKVGEMNSFLNRSVRIQVKITKISCLDVLL